VSLRLLGYLRSTGGMPAVSQVCPSSALSGYEDVKACPRSLRNALDMLEMTEVYSR
jgi:hypothetical protein